MRRMGRRSRALTLTCQRILKTWGQRLLFFQGFPGRWQNLWVKCPSCWSQQAGIGMGNPMGLLMRKKVGRKRKGSQGFSSGSQDPLLAASRP
jgi:hypothetical protein